MFADFGVIVALGIDKQGKKHILGLIQGSSEHHEVVKDLFDNLQARGITQEAQELLFVIDGSAGLRKGINEMYPGAKVQRCIRHKERNIIGYLPKQYHREFYRRWKMIHGLCSHKEAKKQLTSLHIWLSQINIHAANSLEEAKDQALRWSAFILQEAEKKFRRIKGYKDIQSFQIIMKTQYNNLQDTRKAA